MLSMKGDAPISQAILDGFLPPDLQAADLLDNIDLAVQAQGWGFNVEQRELALEGDGTILCPTDTINVHKGEETETDPIKRGSILFDRKNRTTTFTEPVNVLLTVRLDFDDLPEEARRYIFVRAGRSLVANWENAEILWQFSKADEVEARADLMKEELNQNCYTLANSAEQKNARRYN